MENLDIAMKSKKLKDLQVEKIEPKSILLEPTKVEIELILAALKDGKAYKEIKKEIRREEEGSSKGFSYGQIKEIDMARKLKIADLTPVEEVVELKK